MRSPAALFLALVFSGCGGSRATSSASASASAAAAVAHNPASASDGAVVYINNCSSCHQPDGTGIPGAFPPLAANAAVTGSPVAAIAIVKDGLEGRIVVDGHVYSGIMPRWNGVLTDEQIADVLTYIRSSWKNRASAVSISDVEAVK